MFQIITYQTKAFGEASYCTKLQKGKIEYR